MFELTADCEEYSVVLADARLTGVPIVWASAKFRELAGPDTASSIGAEINSVQSSFYPGWNFVLSPVRDEQGRVDFVLGFGSPSGLKTDEVWERTLQRFIDRRGVLRDARNEAAYQAEQVLRGLATSIVAVDGQGLVRIANDAALAFFERDESNTLGQPVGNIMGTTLAQASQSQGIGETRYDQLLMSAKGTPRETGVTLARTRSHRLTDITAIFLLRDLGERRHAELELVRVKGLEALAQMAAGFAHEVRNPLAALKTLAEALSVEFQTGDSRVEYTTRIVALVARMEKLVQHSLLFARPRAPMRSRIEASKACQRAIDRLKERAPSDETRIAVAIDPQLPAGLCDEDQAVDVLLALLENALDAAGAKNRVAVNVRLDTLPNVPTLWLRFDVVDQGSGIAEKNLQRIFHPFFTTKPRALGMSLAISQRLAHDNGGHLLVVSQPGLGTTFSLFIPCATGQ